MVLFFSFFFPFIKRVCVFVQEAAGEKGILEQSEITLVSLTDTTLQDQETTITDEDEPQEDKHPAGAREEGQEGNEPEVIIQLSTSCLPQQMSSDL